MHYSMPEYTMHFGVFSCVKRFSKSALHSRQTSPHSRNTIFGMHLFRITRMKPSSNRFIGIVNETIHYGNQNQNGTVISALKVIFGSPSQQWKPWPHILVSIAPIQSEIDYLAFFKIRNKIILRARRICTLLND